MDSYIENRPVEETNVFEAPQLDSQDPIDRLVINYALAVEEDTLPKLSAQRKIVDRVQAGDELATRLLIRSHLSLVATALYPHKNCGVSRSALLQYGINALITSARTYSSPTADVEFNDHVVRTVESAIVEATPLVSPRFSTSSSSRPMDNVLSFLHGVNTSNIELEETSISPPEKTGAQDKTGYDKLLTEFSPRDLRVLQHIILPYKQIASELNITKIAVKMIAINAQAKTGTQNAPSLALALHKAGMQFDVRKPKQPLVKALDAEEMKITQLLEHPYKVIAEKLGVTYDLKSKVAGMKKRTGARSRAELALMVMQYDTGERRHASPVLPRDKLAAKLGLQSLKGCDVEVLLESATHRQREMVAAYYLTDEPASWANICAKYGIKRAAAMQAAERGIQAMSRARKNTT